MIIFSMIKKDTVILLILKSQQLVLPSMTFYHLWFDLLRGYPKQAEDLIEWLYTYFKFFPLKEEEMLLFQSYLSQPSFMIKKSEGLFREGKNRDERKAVKKLQREYWLLKNIEYVVSRIDEIERQKKLQQQQQEEAQS